MECGKHHKWMVLNTINLILFLKFEDWINNDENVLFEMNSKTYKNINISSKCKSILILYSSHAEFYINCSRSFMENKLVFLKTIYYSKIHIKFWNSGSYASFSYIFIETCMFLIIINLSENHELSKELEIKCRTQFKFTKCT